jgi:hypothetical protein
LDPLIKSLFPALPITPRQQPLLAVSSLTSLIHMDIYVSYRDGAATLGSQESALGTDTERTRGTQLIHKLTDNLCKKLPSPASGNKIHYDTDVKGLGLRVTAAGARSFILTYRTRGGRERRYTIGRFPDWNARAAREKAKELKRRIADGADPLAELESDRDAPTMADLCQRYVEERLPRKRPSSQRNDRSHDRT